MKVDGANGEEIDAADAEGAADRYMNGDAGAGKAGIAIGIVAAISLLSVAALICGGLLLAVWSFDVIIDFIESYSLS